MTQGDGAAGPKCTELVRGRNGSQVWSLRYSPNAWYSPPCSWGQGRNCQGVQVVVEGTTGLLLLLPGPTCGQDPGSEHQTVAHGWVKGATVGAYGVSALGVGRPGFQLHLITCCWRPRVRPLASQGPTSTSIARHYPRGQNNTIKPREQSRPSAVGAVGARSGSPRGVPLWGADSGAEGERDPVGSRGTWTSPLKSVTAGPCKYSELSPEITFSGYIYTAGRTSNYRTPALLPQL